MNSGCRPCSHVSTANWVDSGAFGRLISAWLSGHCHEESRIWRSSLLVAKGRRVGTSGPRAHRSSRPVRRRTLQRFLSDSHRRQNSRGAGSRPGLPREPTFCILWHFSCCHTPRAKENTHDAPVANLLIELSEGWSMSWTLVSKHKRTRPRLFVMIYVCHAFRFANAFGTLL